MGIPDFYVNRKSKMTVHIRSWFLATDHIGNLIKSFFLKKTQNKHD